MFHNLQQSFGPYIYYGSRTLLTWPFILRSLRIYYAYRLRDRPSQNKGPSLLTALMKNEWLLAALSVFIAMVVNVHHLKILRMIDYPEYGRKFPWVLFKSRSVFAIWYAGLEHIVLVLQVFFLRNVDYEHNISPELVAFIAVLVPYHNIDIIADLGKAFIPEYLFVFIGNVLQIARFTCFYVITMYLPLRKAERYPMVATPELVLSTASGIASSPRYAVSFLAFLQHHGRTQAADLFIFLVYLKVVDPNKKEALIEIYDRFFSGDNQLFPAQIENQVRLKRYLGEGFTVEAFDEAHSYALRIVDSIFDQEFSQTVAYRALLMHCEENARFIKRLSELNMIDIRPEDEVKLQRPSDTRTLHEFELNFVRETAPNYPQMG